MALEETVNGWAEQLKRLTAELNHLAHVDNVFWQVQAIIAADAALNVGDVFQQWIGTTYVSTIVTGLRRLVDKRFGSLSLFRLPDRMGASCSVILTRDRFVCGWETQLRGYANRSFDELGGRGLNYIPRSAIESRRKRLRQALEPVIEYANEHVTHLREAPKGVEITFHQVRLGLVEAFVVTRWCSILIAGGEPISPVPAIQTNWLEVFRRSWLPASTPPPKYRHLNELVRGHAREEAKASPDSVSPFRGEQGIDEPHL